METPTLESSKTVSKKVKASGRRFNFQVKQLQITLKAFTKTIKRTDTGSLSGNQETNTRAIIGKT
jgi:hypothetical protein